MTVMQLQGRGTYGPNYASGRGVSPLWRYFSSPPAQNSVAIYTDGRVVEKATFDTSELRPEKGVRTFILGGADFRCLDTSQDYADLVAAGYTFTALPAENTYEASYRDAYTYEWTPEAQANQAALHDKRVADEAAQREADRLARVATLEAELAALKGP